MKTRKKQQQQKAKFAPFLLLLLIFLAVSFMVKNNWLDELLAPVFSFMEAAAGEPTNEQNPNEQDIDAEEPTTPETPAAPDQEPEENESQPQEPEEEPELDYLILVNKEIALAEDYVPPNLTIPSVRFSQEGRAEIKHLQAAAAQALEELFAAAEEEDIILYAVSGYRSYALQKSVYNRHVQNSGQAYADRISARPGHSEHQTGLAMDITSKSVGFGLKTKFGETPEGQWVAENAHRFGFIIRYPEGKEDLTGYNYEPWHLRYVGKAAAQTIFEQDLILEEYIREYIDAAR